MSHYTKYKLEDGVAVHTQVSKSIKLHIEQITKDTKIPQCVIINHILTEFFMAKKKAPAKKAIKKVAKKAVKKVSKKK